MQSERETRGILRLLTCGSVDDGKSTLIGRLLYDTAQIADDTLAAVERDSRRFGTTGDTTDYALLVDGLEAEREQGITIDVAYRFFATGRRNFIIADAPGHEQFTRNMVTGASQSDVALVLLDARKGMLTQTRRHMYICHLLGIPQLILAVNKLDLVDYAEPRFAELAAAGEAFAKSLGISGFAAIPIAARQGDNIVHRSMHMPWYSGPTLLDMLEQIDIDGAAVQPLRFCVQYVNRPHQDFRGYCGTIAAGRVAVGDRVINMSSGRQASVARLITPGGDVALAETGDAITLLLQEEIDVARGDMLAHPRTRPQKADQFAGHLVWMGEHPMLPGRQYLVRMGTTITGMSISQIKHRIDVDRLEQRAARKLEMNEIGFCNFSLDHELPFDPYAECRATGSFIVIDRETRDTVGAGMVAFPLRRATNIHAENFIDQAARARLLGQQPRLVWLTGLSGAGKSTIARQLEVQLHAAGRLAYVLDGDNLRHGLNRDLGFTEADRVENIRRAGEVGKLLVDAGLIVIAAFISPFRAERDAIRAAMPQGAFVEVFVDATLDECKRRDPKGLYAKALGGQLRNFTGIDSPYEPPLAPELHLNTTHQDSAAAVAAIMRLIGA